MNSINAAAQAAGATFTAQLATTGNGIELVDNNPADGPITVTANSQSTAAVDLGLVPAGQTSAQSQLRGRAADHAHRQRRQSPGDRQHFQRPDQAALGPNEQ